MRLRITNPQEIIRPKKDSKESELEFAEALIAGLKPVGVYQQQAAIRIANNLLSLRLLRDLQALGVHTQPVLNSVQRLIKGRTKLLADQLKTFNQLQITRERRGQ